MRYLDSIFVNEEADARIRARCEAINRSPTLQAPTFDAAMSIVIRAGLDALDAADVAAAQPEQGVQVRGNPLAGMQG